MIITLKDIYKDVYNQERATVYTFRISDYVLALSIEEEMVNGLYKRHIKDIFKTIKQFVDEYLEKFKDLEGYSELKNSLVSLLN